MELTPWVPPQVTQTREWTAEMATPMRTANRMPIQAFWKR